MRDLTVAKRNMEGALKAFDTRHQEMMVRRPVSMKKLLEIFEKAPELQGIPTFRRKGRIISVSGQCTFEYSVLGESITSFCIGLDQLLVGFDLERLSHHAFETFAWYSSAFQFMDSIMSIRGVNFVHKPSAPVLVRTARKKVLGHRRRKELLELVDRHFEIPFLRGETDGLSWSFQSALPSHETRWIDFGKLLIALIDSKKSKEIPSEIRDLYGYLKAVSDFRAHRFEWMDFTVKFQSEGQFKSAIAAHGKGIANIRHRAVYQNQTYDSFSYAMLEQGRKVDEFTNAGKQFVKRFALAMAKWNAGMLGEIWLHLKSMTPSPQRGLDWLDLTCRYIPLQIALTEVRLEKIHANRKIASIHNVIPDLATDILVSSKMHKLWVRDRRPIPLD